MLDLLKERGYDINKIKKDVEMLVMKVFLALRPGLLNAYFPTTSDINEPGKNFKILGVDVMLDKYLYPYIIEINPSPDLKIWSYKHSCYGQSKVKVDYQYRLKTKLIENTIKLITSGDPPEQCGYT